MTLTEDKNAAYPAFKKFQKRTNERNDEIITDKSKFDKPCELFEDVDLDVATPGSAVLELCDKDVDVAELEFAVLLTNELFDKDVVFDVAKVAIAVLLADDPCENNVGVAPPRFAEVLAEPIERIVLVWLADSP
ncbi:hypothetical protein MMC29_006022 [Sticta canariensis]|nr:hypothetical protein [Sticta canariensis]